MRGFLPVGGLVSSFMIGAKGFSIEVTGHARYTRLPKATEQPSRDGVLLELTARGGMIGKIGPRTPRRNRRPTPRGGGGPAMSMKHGGAISRMIVGFLSCGTYTMDALKVLIWEPGALGIQET